MTDLVSGKYRQAPHSPGVYLMKDAKGRIIYVGKADDLKKRLSSYFISKNSHDPKTAALIEIIKDFEIIITSSGHEAFILESNLIKEYNPKYNVILKDGKNYPLLRIDMNEKYPAIQRVRKIKDDNALYFGPYSSSHSVNKTLKQIQKIFKLRRCKNTQFRNRSRPCLNFQIKACLGLCCNDVPETEYKNQVQDAVLFLKGRSDQVIKKLETRMMAHASCLEYEKAARTRDAISAIKNIMKKQVVVSADMKDKDIVALAADKGTAAVVVMSVRSGRLIDTAHYPIDLGFKEPDEILPPFLKQYYKNTAFLPDHILLNQNIDGSKELEKQFASQKGRKVVIHVPVRGSKKRLVDMARINASELLEKKVAQEEQERASLMMLKALLKMEKAPERIECFDNASLAGQNPVSAMAVFKNGRPCRNEYRRFIIRGLAFNDDYAAMYQVLKRRFSKDPSEMEFPDLLVVDGGRGQLSMAMAVLKSLNIQDRFMVAGLAKKNEKKQEKFDKIYIPGRSNPLNTNQAAKALYLLMQIRDEAHRFANTFQRKRREKLAGLSVLETIPGIGPKKRQTLLKHFKGIHQIKKSSVNDIAALPGLNKKLAQAIIQKINL